jgi:hypothetical protein
VAEKVLAWQKAGGVVVGDDRLAPGIKADIVLPSFERPQAADEARKLLQRRAAELWQQLQKRYQRYGAAQTPDVVTRFRQFGSTDYLFAVNDQREFGDYVGRHGLVMENGLPTDAELVVRRRTGHVYDLIASRMVTARAVGGLLRWTQHFGPCDGHIYMITDRAVDRVIIAAPKTARRGQQITWNVKVCGSDSEPLDAVVPVRVEIVDPEGREAEFSGYHAAKSGDLQLTTDLAPNDRPGLWLIRATELASGRQASHYLRVTTD